MSRVVGINDPAIFKELRMTVAFFDMSVWIRTKNRYAATKMIIDEDGRFPTGLVKRVGKFLTSKRLMWNLADNRILPKYKCLSLRNRLEEPPEYAEQELAVSAMMKHEGGVCEIATGVGKSRIIKEFLLKTQRPTLVITPSGNLRSQTYEYLSESFGTDDVGLLRADHDKPIIVSNYHALASKDASYFKQFTGLVFDEFHKAAAEGVRNDFNDKLYEIYYRHGMTATNFKNNDNSNIYLESVLSDTLYSFSTIEAINKGYVRPLVSFFHEMKNLDLVSKNNYKSDTKRFIDQNMNRNHIAIEVAKKMYHSNIPTIMLVEHMEHGKYLQQQLGSNALFLNGQDESSSYNMQMVKRFNKKEIPILIGTDVLGEGVDTKACGALVNLGGGKARSELMQKCGRTIRNFFDKKVGYYFDFNDLNQKHLRLHSKERIKIIEEVYGKSVNIIN